MQIYKGTTASTGNLRITKDVGEFCLQIDDANPMVHQQTLISAHIERKTGGRVEIFNKRPLFMMALLMSSGLPFLSAVKHADSRELPRCTRLHFDLGLNTHIALGNTDQLVITIDGLPVGKIATLFALDDVMSSNKVPKVEVHNMLLQTTESKFTLHPDDEFVLLFGEIERAKLHTIEGKTLEYSKSELEIIQNDIIPSIGKTLAVTEAASTQRTLVDTPLLDFLDNCFLIPSIGLESIEITKPVDEPADLYTLRYEPIPTARISSMNILTRKS